MWNFLYWFGASDWHFLAGCNSQNCHNGRPAITDLNLQLTMTSPLIGHVHGFISTSTLSLTAKLWRIADKNAITLTCSWPWRHHKHLWFYLHLYQACNNQIWQNGRPAWIDFTLHMAMTSLLKSHVRNTYFFISTSTRSMTTEIGRMAEHHTLTLPCIWKWCCHL